MRENKNINALVFPCGSEIGVEIYNALHLEKSITLFGASSVEDQGRAIYKKFIPSLPFINSKCFADELKKVVAKYEIDIIIPTMDSVLHSIRSIDFEHCKVAAPSLETVKTCESKALTFAKLDGEAFLPKIYQDVPKKFPVFVKPVVGYGSRGAITLRSELEYQTFSETSNVSDFQVCEYLPGEEYTVDCLTDSKGNLLFIRARSRSKISSGISTSTAYCSGTSIEALEIGKKINQSFSMIGAWFFQVKRCELGNLKLMEVASRIGGSSGISRVYGVNLPLLNLLVHLGIDIEILENDVSVRAFRPLSSRFVMSYDFDIVYVDFDDCLVNNGKLNYQLLAFLADCQSAGKDNILISRHDGDLVEYTKKLGVHNIFKDIVHIRNDAVKSKFISGKKAIFIDDSHRERRDVFLEKNIPVFAPEVVKDLVVT